MFDKDIASVRRRRWRLAALALLGLGGALAGLGETPGLPAPAEARTARPEQIGGTWVATWQNSRGAPRKGLIVVRQRGSQLSATIERDGTVTATGSIAGAAFTLRGTRMGLPFTITGRVQGKKMSGLLTALMVERSFTAVRRR